MERFPAVVATGPGPASIQQLTEDELVPDPVTIDVAFSSLNYKDGLAVTGRGKVIRSFPMICGIDLAGTVRSSQAEGWQAGDEVIVTGFGLGETHPGGYTERQRLRPEWLVRPPAGLDLRRAMALGTAGFTAMLSVMALEHNGLQPSPETEVLVTGAGGGVGSVAVALLAREGYRVAASTGRPEVHAFLRELGATEIVDRQDLAARPERPLSKERWSGVVDTVGSTTLASALAQTRSRGTVAACGLAGGSDLGTTVMPFILRGVQLAGIDSAWCPMPLRHEAWRRLAASLPGDLIDDLSETRPMSTITELAEAVLAGKVRGRVVVDPHA
jgi:acrylyl-CoA reductase (NADPH)